MCITERRYEEGVDRAVSDREIKIQNFKPGFSSHKSTQTEKLIALFKFATLEMLAVYQLAPLVFTKANQTCQMECFIHGVNFSHPSRKQPRTTFGKRKEKKRRNLGVLLKKF